MKTVLGKAGSILRIVIINIHSKRYIGISKAFLSNHLALYS